MKNKKGFLVFIPLVVIIALITIGNKALEKKNASKYDDVTFNYESDGSVTQEPLIIDNYDASDDIVTTTEENTTEVVTTEEVSTEAQSTEEVASETDASTEETTEEDVSQPTQGVMENNYTDIIISLFSESSNYYQGYTTDAFKSAYVVPDPVKDVMGTEVGTESSYENKVVFVTFLTMEGSVNYKVSFTLSEDNLLDSWVVEKQ